MPGLTGVELTKHKTPWVTRGLAIYRSTTGQTFHIVQVAEDWRTLCGLRASPRWHRYSISIWRSDPSHRCPGCAGHAGAAEIERAGDDERSAG